MSSRSESDISDDDSANAERVEELHELLEEEQNKYNFAIYKELIDIQRGMGNLDEVRDARHKVQKLFCLPE